MNRQRYWKILDKRRRSFYVTGGSPEFSLVYPPHEVVWTKPSTLGIFVFTNIRRVISRGYLSGNSGICVEIFPLGWMAKPEYVAYSDTIAKVLPKTSADSIFSLVSEMNKFKDRPLFAQKLWEDTVCCEGVLVGNRFSSGELEEIAAKEY